MGLANLSMEDRHLFLDELDVDASTAAWKGENEITYDVSAEGSERLV